MSVRIYMLMIEQLKNEVIIKAINLKRYKVIRNGLICYLSNERWHGMEICGPIKYWMSLNQRIIFDVHIQVGFLGNC